MAEYNKKGYLYSNFKIFHLKDSNLGEIDFHYHDFHKVLIHLSGNASYSIEGQNFDYGTLREKLDTGAFKELAVKTLTESAKRKVADNLPDKHIEKPLPEMAGPRIN